MESNWRHCLSNLYFTKHWWDVLRSPGRAGLRKSRCGHALQQHFSPGSDLLGFLVAPLFIFCSSSGYPFPGWRCSILPWRSRKPGIGCSRQPCSSLWPANGSSLSHIGFHLSFFSTSVFRSFPFYFLGCIVSCIFLSHTSSFSTDLMAEHLLGLWLFL